MYLWYSNFYFSCLIQAKIRTEPSVPVSSGLCCPTLSISPQHLLPARIQLSILFPPLPPPSTPSFFSLFCRSERKEKGREREKKSFPFIAFASNRAEEKAERELRWKSRKNGIKDLFTHCDTINENTLKALISIPSRRTQLSNDYCYIV